MGLGGEEKPGVIAQRRAGGASAARCPALLPEVTRNGRIRTEPPMSAGAEDEDGDDRSPVRAAAPRDTTSPKANPATLAGPQPQRRQQPAQCRRQPGAALRPPGIFEPRQMESDAHKAQRETEAGARRAVSPGLRLSRDIPVAGNRDKQWGQQAESSPAAGNVCPRPTPLPSGAPPQPQRHTQPGAGCWLLSRLDFSEPGKGARSGGVEPHTGPPKNSPELPGAQRSAQSPAGIPEPPTAARMETVGPNLAPPRSPPAPSPSSARRDASGSSGRHRAVRRHEALRGIFSSAGRA
ncbi:translation initiation factor IF-2-like [Lagopus muta]|uniref:translation initiation factor IF-2-like n=1 Tax=Lagopus muta TaxID=64668 RepID=UPI00209E7DF5|nr:translation initiation factor IF-2-like [Lagopus muta]